MTKEALEILSDRQLNRALLARQHLLEQAPAGTPLTQVIEDIGGLQTQYAPAGYLALFARMADFQREDLTRAMEAREVIHGTLMRVTLHSVTARDYWPISIGIRDARRAWLDRVTARDRDVERRDAAIAAVVELLSAGPLKLRDLSAAMRARGIDPIPPGVAGVWLDIVRVPPSGTWQHRANDLFALAERYIPLEELHPQGAPTEEDGLRLMLARYLRGFGPARPVDFANWAGLPPAKVKHIVEAAGLRRFHDEQGRVLVDLPDGLLPDPDTPAPVRFLPVWDPTLLVHARAKGMLAEHHRPLIFNTKTPHSVNTFVVDGRVAGTWRYDLGAVVTEAFTTLRPAERRAVATEAERLTAFHAG